MQRACTHITRSPSCLLELSRFFQRTVRLTPTQVLLFSIAPSVNIEPGVLSEVVSSLSKVSPNHVGCISAPLPYQCAGPYEEPALDHCSVALALIDGVPFRSAIPGRAEPQVGRWHAGRQRQSDAKHERGETDADADVENAQARVLGSGSDVGGSVDWERVWDRSARSLSFDSFRGSETGQSLLPDNLQRLEPSTVHSILCFSDKAPEGIASVLENAFPSANKLSLIASSTPFLTGRPVTLFHNGEVYSDGTVGIALTSSAASPPLVDLAFPPLVALTSDLVVTSSEGNLILSIDDGNPTRLLLAAIQKHGLSHSAGSTWIGKEDEFYVGVIKSDVIVQLYRINSGDPSRGTIALDTMAAPKEGHVVRLYHLPRERCRSFDVNRPFPPFTFLVAPETSPESLQSPTSSPSPKSYLAVNPQDEFHVKRAIGTKHMDGMREHGGAEGTLMSRSGAFYAASENGFTLSRGKEKGSSDSDATTVSEAPWTCIVPGGRVGLMFDVPEDRNGSENASRV